MGYIVPITLQHRKAQEQLHVSRGFQTKLALQNWAACCAHVNWNHAKLFQCELQRKALSIPTLSRTRSEIPVRITKEILLLPSIPKKIENKFLKLRICILKEIKCAARNGQKRSLVFKAFSTLSKTVYNGCLHNNKSFKEAIADKL